MASLYLRHPIQYPTPVRHHEVIPGTRSGTTISAAIQHPSTRRPTPTVAAAAATAAGPVDGAGEQSPGGGDDSYRTAEEIKAALYEALEGTNRGIFGITSAKKSVIEGLVELLESRNPTPQPTDYLLDKVDGCWKLIYSSITILGVKRTKLGLRDFITLGDFFQIIDVAKERAINVIKFNVRGFGMITGQLMIEASFKIASKTRVDIKLENSNITPDQLMNLFQKNYDLLLAIFNPEVLFLDKCQDTLMNR